MKNLNLIKRLWTDSHEKQKPQRFARYAAILIMLLTLGVGQMWAANFPAGSILFLNAGDYWKQNNAWFAIYFYGGDGEKWVRMTRIGSTDYYYAEVPSGSRPNCIFCRMDKDKDALEWNSRWNQSGDLTYESGKNFWQKGASNNDWSAGTWGTYKPTSTASLSGTSSITTAETSTLAPSITNTEYNEIYSTSYSVTTNPGSAGSVTSGGVFSASAAGTYVVTATVTYNPKGFSSLTSTATVTKNITVTAASTYTLSYNGNGNTSGTAPSSSVHAKNAIATVAVKGDLAMTNYTFSGWNTSQYITGTDYAARSSITMSSDITLYAKWTRTVTLDQNGATTNSSPTSVTGIWNCSTLPTITNPSKDYYSFQGWNTKADVAGSIVINTSGAYNSGKPDWTDASGRFARSKSKDYATLYAKWTQSVTLKANTSNHGSGSDQTATATWNYKTISIPTHCTPADGYKLEGYYTAETGGTKILNADGTYAGTNVSAGGDTYISSSKWAHAGTTTLWAQYTPIQYTITFDKQSGSSGTNSATVHFNNNDFSVSPVVAPTRTGYTFGGYYTGTSGSGEQIVNASGVWQNSKTNYLDGSGNWIYAGNKIVYAKWTEVLTTVTINVSPASTGTLTVGGGAFTPGNTTTAGVSTSRSVVATAANDYAFSSWSVSGNATGTSSTNTYTLKGNGSGSTGTLTANFTLIPVKLYKLSKAKNGDITDKGTMSYDPSSSAYYMDITTDASPYYFRFYHNGSTQYCSDWKDKWDGGYTSGKEVVANGSKVDCDKAVSGWGDKPGMYYTGASGSGIRIWFDYQNKKAWITETGYDVTVYDGDHGTVSPNGTVNVGGAGVSLTATPSTGYHFTSWSKGGTVANIGLSSTTTNPTTLTATGTGGTVTANYAINTYTIHFNKNDGSRVGDATGSMEDITGVVYGDEVTLTTNDFALAHYTFTGWATSSGGSKVYDDGDKVSNLSSTHNGTANLYAVWEEIPYTVTLQNATTGSVSAGCETGTSITASSAPFGMGFDHWEVVSGTASFTNQNASTTTVKASTDATVKAVFAQKLYAYIEGRFHVADASSPRNWTNTFGNGNWDQNSTRIPFSYDATRHVFYLHTYAKASELSTKISDYDPYFYIKTSSSSSSASDGSATIKSYKCNLSGTVISTVGYDNKIQFDYIHNNTTDDKNANLRFNSSDVTAYITIFFDGTYIWYEYMPAIINTINLSGTRVPPMAEITATPSMSYKGATDRAYCWGVYSDEECTSPVNVSFTSLGSGRVQFTVPQTMGTYYLKLTVRASAACNASIDDEEVQSFNVTTDNMVFFNKTDIPWSGVFVYFLGDGSYWDKDLGSGCASKDYGRANEMHRIGKSDIYYYEYSGNALGNNDIQYIAFTEYGKPNSEHFAYTNAAYRVDFKRSCAPMYVPENWITDRLNNCEYYNRGYWTTYGVSGVARNAGFTLKVFDKFDGGTQLESVDLSNTDGSNTYRATVNLDYVNYSYGYQLLSCGNKYYGNDGVMNANNSTNWKFEPDKHRCGLNSQAAGKYIFIVQCTDGGEVRVSVEYPLMNGDYRLIYNDTCVYQTGWHPSQFIRHNYSDGAKLDTVSMYIRPNKQPTLKIQVCDDASSTPPTWRDSITYDVSGLTYGHGVYNFYISQEDGKLTINDVRPYTGLYYIRTQQVDGGWYSYKTNNDNVMTYTEYAEQKNYGFNYYKAKWIGTTGADVTFTIACDYSESLCDTMVADPGNNPLNASQARSIPHSASVRFGWNSLTNTLHRAYINGTSIVSDRYLVMIGDEKLKNSEGEPLAISGLNPNEIGFTDLNNWIYRCDVKAVTGAEVQLVGNYDGHTQHFIGTAEKPEEIIGGDSGEEYLMRVTYDFKTNRLMTAWLPDGDAITSNMTLNADMMLIREGQNAATQVYFGEGYKDRTINQIHSIYGVMEFQYSKFANQFPNWSAAHAYEYLMYYVSFPFDVKVSEIFGCGVRGKNWIIQKYNGAKRAKIGWFAETSTFWETLPGDSTLHAHEGYLLLLDRISFNDPGSNVWTNRPEKVYLYFPSISNTIGTISDKDKSIEVPSHVCDINRSFTVDGVVGELNHRNTDSHWNVIGTPLFENKEAASIAEPEADGNGEKTLQYYYAWDCADNTLSARSSLTTSTEFKSMHGYMVQYSGTVTFHGASIEAVPASVAARHMPSDEKNYRIELQLINENGKTNRTYVELRENACDTFALNEDMYMMRSSRTVDLYSFAGAYDVAANVLSVNNHIVPVGTDVKVAGTYRFTMPSDFSGTVTLIDTETGTRTNLAFGDYEVNLPKGTSNNRFFLEININKMPTAIDGVDGGSLKDGKAHKFIENGQMYILQNGIIYDAQGKRMK